MRKVTFPGLAGLLLLFASLSAFAVNYVQTVQPVVDANGTAFTGGPTVWTTSVGGGRTFSFYGRYIATSDKTTGLGLNVAFDGTKIQNVVIDTVLTKCLIQLPVLTGEGTAAARMQIDWADTGHRADGSVGWPGAADAPSNGISPPDPAAVYPCMVPPQCSPAGVGSCPAVPPPLYVPNTAAVPVPTTLFRFTATTVAGFTSGTTDIVITASSKAAPPDPVNDTSTFTDQTLRITGVVAPACNLDVDASGGAASSLIDGVLIKRALNTFLPAANITIGINFPASATRKDGQAIRTFVQAMGNVLDVDNSGASTPQSLTDGVLIQRALNTFLTSNQVTLGITTNPPGKTGAQIRQYMNSVCGTTLSTAP